MPGGEWETDGGGEGVHDPVLTLSKSIAVKTGVPIQVVLEEKGTEPEQSPWGEQLPYPPTPNPKELHYPYLSISHYWPYMAALMNNRTLNYHSRVWKSARGGVGWLSEWRVTQSLLMTLQFILVGHTIAKKQKMKYVGENVGCGHSSNRSIWSFVVVGTFASLISASFLKARILPLAPPSPFSPPLCFPLSLYSSKRLWIIVNGCWGWASPRSVTCSDL